MEANITEKIRIILVEDHVIVRDGIKMILQSERNIEIVGEASSYSELKKMLEYMNPDILIMDISLPDVSGIEITTKLSKSHPEIKVIILSMHIKEDFIFNSIKAGTRGYLPKNTSKSDLINAVNTVYKGGEYYSAEVSNIVLKSYLRKAKGQAPESEDRMKQLTAREEELLKMFVSGMSNKEIAEKLFISARTVESHKNHIMNKLKLETNIDLLRFAIKNGIIEIE